jgi:hypothetical protein
VRVQQLEYENSAMEKNYKMHYCEMDDDISIDNISIIAPTPQPPLDDSSLNYCQEVLALYEREEQFQADKAQLINEVRLILAANNQNTTPTPQESLLFRMTAKVLAYV